MRQLAAVQPFELSNGSERGVRCVRMRNAVGLEFTITADRGLGIYDLQVQGVPLSLITSAGVVHPAFVEHTGLGWLRTWPGGFLTPCGLTQVGSPCNDQGEELGLHGRLSQLPAHDLRWGAEWQQDEYILWVEGTLRETAAMGVRLALKRRIWTRLDAPYLRIEDRVENEGSQTAPLMFLHHFNLGFPLVDASARLVLPSHTTEPRDDQARVDRYHYTEFSEPIADYPEQVFYHDVQPDEAGRVEVRFVNPAFNSDRGLGIALRYRTDEFPVLVQWKMMREGLYVVGLEPANCHVEGRVAERERGTLQLLPPQAARTFNIEVAFFDNASIQNEAA